ncbi:MAG: hypothetical protein AB7O47_06545 [Flavobacteriales bacterium]
MVTLCIDSVTYFDWSILTPLIVASLTILGSIYGWYLNNKETREFEIYKRKEERYLNLLKNLKGFYEGNSNDELKTIFIDEYNSCWMYCSDSIIKKGNAFLNSIHTESNTNQKDKQIALAEFVLEMRFDLQKYSSQSNSQLKVEDFKTFTSNKI